MKEILDKLKKHDQRFDEHNRRFDAHDKRFDDHDRRFDEHDKRFDAIDKRFDQIDGQIDFLATKLLQHDDRLERIEENMATKADLRGISETLDKLVGLSLKKDQEVTFLTHSVRNLWNKFEEHDQDIKQMKPMLGLN